MKIKYQRILFTALLVLCAAGCRCAEKQTAPELTIDRNSRYQIVCPDSYPNPGTTQLVKQVAEKLRTAFKETVGADFAVVRESKRDPRMKAVFVGRTKALLALGIEPRDFRDFNYLIKVDNGNIYLAGNDRNRFNKTKREHGFSRYVIGSAKAAVVFMEKYLDTRFVMPGEVGTDYAKLKSVSLPGDCHINGVPPLKMALGRNWDFFYDYANTNYGPGTYFSHGGHSYYTAVPAQKYFKTHPEYFAIISEGGKRDPNGNHLCISNPEVQNLIYQEVIDRLDEGAEMTELAQTDGYLPCLCENCKKYGNTDDPGEKLWILHRDICERVGKARPGKMVMMMCYGPTAKLPVSFKKFPDNVMVQLCSYSPAKFEQLKNYSCKHGFTTYIYNWGYYNTPGFTAKRTPEFCAEQVRLFLKNNVRGIYRCGFGDNFGMEGPTYYAYGKLLEDPDRATADIVSEYCRRAFHEAAVPMQKFYNQLNDGVALFSSLESVNRNRAVGHGCRADGKDKYRNPMPKSARALMTAMYPPERLDSMGKLLDRAETLSKDPKVRKRLELVRFEFEYTRTLVNALHLYNAYRVTPDKANFERLANAIGKRNKLLDKAFDKKGKVKPFPGWREIPLFEHKPRSIVQVNGKSSAVIGTPLSWNIANLRKNNILPGANVKRMKIARARGPVNFDNFEKGAWAAAQWHTLGGIQLGPVSEQTKFKMLYDSKNLYVAAIAETDAKREYAELGQDGAVWRQDCFELTLDPKGARESYYHLAWNPLPNSCYDSATGFISDPLDPLYGLANPNWNGKWSYQTRREGNLWYTMAKIPFETLNAKVAPGTIWTLNVGREIRIPPKRNVELALWSPNFETCTFHDRDSFGEAVFE